MELLNFQQIKELQTLRKWLHQNPEISGKERNTAARVEAFLKDTYPAKIIPGIGGNGVAAVFDSARPGKTLMVRADLDALPIQEINTFTHRSQNEGISHKCGHDGHAAILAGLAMALQKNPLQEGRVVLLFQPEEETGHGAVKVIKDEAFKMIKPDHVIGFHNLPGFPLSSFILREGTFAAASAGMIIRMKGTSSHAAHPEQGISPARMLSEAITGIQKIPQREYNRLRDFTLVTVIHAQLGEPAFGTSPGDAVLMATLRAFQNEDMRALKKAAEIFIKTLAEDNRLRVEITYQDEFPATINDPDIIATFRRGCEKLDENVIEPGEPFRWSEDFGHYGMLCPSAMIGIGSGTDSPGLHTPDYDFPDEIIPGAVQVLYHAMKEMLGN
jgi:amidohydrolase